MSPILFSTAAVLAGMAAGLGLAGGLLWRQHQVLLAARAKAARALHLATHDDTTGLPNRRALLRRLDTLLRTGGPLGLVLLDLDGFKAVNDSFGHETGNDLLTEVGQRLAALPPPVVLAARLSGDEYALLVAGEPAHVAAAARAAWHAVDAATVTVAEQTVRVAASVGYACHIPGVTAHTLLRAADEAMYQAKTSGLGVYGPATGDPGTGSRYRDRPTEPAVPIQQAFLPPKQRTHAPVATDLYFTLTETLRLAEHAIAAPAHNPSFTEHTDAQPCPGALAWVADEGTYLMSTGRPGLRVDPTNPDSSHAVVYAQGWEPDSDRRDLAHTDVGGDDFVEHLHLTSTDQPGQPPLIDLLRTGARRGYQYLVVSVTGDTYDLRLSRQGPDGQ